MKFLDKIYLYIYWCVSKKLDAKGTTIWILNYLLFPILTGLIVLLFGFTLFVTTIKLDFKIIVGIGLVMSFFFSEKLIDIYFDLEKQKHIISSYNKPGIHRYFIFALTIIVSLSIMIFSSLIAGVLVHQ